MVGFDLDLKDFIQVYEDDHRMFVISILFRPKWNRKLMISKNRFTIILTTSKRPLSSKYKRNFPII